MLGGWNAGRRAVAAAIVALGALICVASAAATHLVAGNLVIDFGFDSAPKALPHSHDAPVRFWGHAEIGTRDGSAPEPVTHVTAELDRFGHAETRGLPRCSRGRLIATTPERARSLCPGAIVGTGYGKVVITFPEQAPIVAGTAVTFFNGPPIGGDPSVIVHAHLDVPVPTTYLVPVRIERIHKGIYGYRLEATVPPIAGGYGAPTSFKFKVGRSWRFRGRELSYVNARCPNSRLVHARVSVEFGGGTVLSGSFLDDCRIREG